MPDAIPLHERATMRVLAFDQETVHSEPLTIRAVARVDVSTHPVLGSGVGRLMAATLGPHGFAARPFTGQRLVNAIWNPSPPDILVSADAGTRSAVPDAVRRELPWIIVLRVWRRLRPRVPSNLLEICWDHGSEAFMPFPAPSPLEREAWFSAMVLYDLLHRASPAELVAYSRDA